MKRFIISTLILSTVIVGKAQNAIPQSLRELSKWEKAMKVKANSGDADACRLLALSNWEKYAGYGQHAMELYSEQKTGEAYYHMAELCINDTELRDSFLLQSKQLGYAKASEQIEALKKSQQSTFTAEVETSTHNTTYLSDQPMRDVALSIELERTPEEAKFYMEAAKKYQNIHHRREAIWYYDLAYSIDPNGCSEAKNRADELRQQMRRERYHAQQQLQQEQLQREINSQQWQQLAIAASNLTASLQHPRSSSATTYRSQSSAATPRATSNSYTSDNENKLNDLRNERRENAQKKATDLGSRVKYGADKKEETCRNCKGSGKVNCHVCHGKGTISCPGCNGNGYPAGFKNRTCSICNGRTRVKCNWCYGKGTEKCISCNGKGKK
ncbi:molecular chaperone DnaJ [Xylanibacter brevis]|uniref:hypothetical protein n=1 Tax=Xylanibacter brevis TaxID=83231 RepID=UPI000B156FF7|nr:hypothetical protein [Xylanibacter brevis]